MVWGKSTNGKTTRGNKWRWRILQGKLTTIIIHSKLYILIYQTRPLLPYLKSRYVSNAKKYVWIRCITIDIGIWERAVERWSCRLQVITIVILLLVVTICCCLRMLLQHLHQACSMYAVLSENLHVPDQVYCMLQHYDKLYEQQHSQGVLLLCPLYDI